MAYERHPLHDLAYCPVHRKTKIRSKPGNRKNGSPSIWCAVQGDGDGFNDNGYCDAEVRIEQAAAPSPGQSSGSAVSGRAAAPVSRLAPRDDPAFQRAIQRGIAMSVALKAGVDFANGGQLTEGHTRQEVAFDFARRAYNELLIPALRNAVPLANGQANVWTQNEPGADDDIPF